jgi:single-strand DNA-binding protein
MINKAILVGNVGKDPEVRYTADGTAVANFSVATTDKWKDKKTGEMKSATEWHRIVCFNRTAEVVGDYVKKGMQVYIEGKIQYRSWEKEDNTKAYITEIKAPIVKFLGGKGGGKSKEDYQSEAYNNDEPSKAPAPEDDDIPF